jgi:hypothetical protein
MEGLWRRLVTCNCDDAGATQARAAPMRFTHDTLRAWANLFLWDGQPPHALLPSVSDDAVRLNILAADESCVRFLVTWAPGVRGADWCGEYVSARARSTTDPRELRQLLAPSTNGARLHAELLQAFPVAARVRFDD